ncbi:M1 family aminopeptidase [Polyangium aurulentum]|uniref:M1 family aminopeptidase n=1 Tax=Polyangium aurulentum TaxID=2567896 RepID=UPI0010ADB6ED|nr:M1 family aminopeptidase [Polyangium aurulentum]UQA61579.1 HEAT repeat domain-containing protein [Polyangium aurulentum]
MSLEHRLHDRCACGSSLSSYSQALGAARPFALAGVQRVYERSRPFKVEHIALDLSLHISKKSVTGVATLELARIDARATEVALDAVGFDLESVELSLEGADAFAPATHGYDGQVLRVQIPERAAKASIRVKYRATPRRGLYFLAPDEHVQDRPTQVWSQCQDEDARHIFPCIDKPHNKQTTALRVTVPPGWFALSNGALENDEAEQQKGIYRYRFDDPHPSYLFSLVAGEFARIDAEAEGVKLHYFVPKGREADGARTFRRTPEMVRRFGALTGVPYPWKSYSQIVVSDFIFGGMENTTATTMYEHILLDERAAQDITSDDLIAHELAHHWFGDLVTCRDWSHAWLNEGFATYMEHVDREGNLGRDEYEHGVRTDVTTYVSEAHGRYRRPIVCQDYEAPIDIFDRHLYEKGGCVLHMLRLELGDEAFWRGVGVYLRRHARGIVETRDLMRALEEESGKSLERFFEQWVYRAGHPELDVKIECEGETCTVSVKQAQHQPGKESKDGEGSGGLFAFDLVLDLAFEGEQGVRREVRQIDQANQVITLRVPKRPKFVVVDPELRIVGEVRVEAPRDLLRAQLAGAPTARGRLLAAAPLGKLDDPATTRALGESIAKEDEFWGVRAEAAAALGQIRSDEAFEVLAQHARTAHPKVRRAVISALGKFKTAKAADVLRAVALRDSSYLVEAEAARALGATRQSAAFDTLIEVLDKPSWADVIRAGAIDGLAALRDDRALSHVTARTRYGIPTRGRRAAIVALPKLSGDRKVRETLEELLDAADPYLKVDVVRAIVEMGDAKSRGALSRQLDRELDGRVRRRIREALRDLGASGKRETERLREEIESLRGEHAELKARLGKLEALVPAPKEDGETKKKTNGASAARATGRTSKAQNSEPTGERVGKAKKARKKDVRPAR